MLLILAHVAIALTVIIAVQIADIRWYNRRRKERENAVIAKRPDAI